MSRIAHCISRDAHTDGSRMAAARLAEIELAADTSTAAATSLCASVPGLTIALQRHTMDQIRQRYRFSTSLVPFWGHSIIKPHYIDRLKKTTLEEFAVQYLFSELLASSDEARPDDEDGFSDR